MAHKVLVTLEDDLDGSPADETLAFGLEGSSYEIDLNSENAKKLRASLAPFVEKARLVKAAPERGRPRNSATTITPPRRTDPEKLAEIRAWAKDQGMSIKDRGRVPAVVIEKYDAAHAA